jgi:hypothetical protein
MAQRRELQERSARLHRVRPQDTVQSRQSLWTDAPAKFCPGSGKFVCVLPTDFKARPGLG